MEPLYWGLRSLEAGAASQNQAFKSYATQFNSLEISSTYHRVPSLATVARWRTRAPAGFRYSLMAPRVLRYQPTGAERRALRRFLHRAQALGPTLGAVHFVVPEVPWAAFSAWLEFLPSGQFAFSLSPELAPCAEQAGHAVVNGGGSFKYLIDPNFSLNQVCGYAYFSAPALVNIPHEKISL